MKDFNELAFHEHVCQLFVKPEDQLMGALHAGVGISGESGEILDTLKKSWIYGKEIDVDNILEECGDVLFYVVALLDKFDMTLGEAAHANMVKLAKRYPRGYTDEHANARMDKQ